MSVEVAKSSRHSKITGDFGEAIVLYWLSKHGLECAKVDHVGMDLIARLEGSSQPFGISVKARSRNKGKEGEYLSIPNDNFEKLEAACEAFGCIPYFAIVVDERDQIDVFILSSNYLQTLHPQRERVSSWKMGEKWRAKYLVDENIVHFTFGTTTNRWWQSALNS